MKFETLVKRLEKGEKLKIYVTDSFVPFIITGYVKRSIIGLGGLKMVDLEPYIGLKLISDAYGNGLCGRINSDVKIKPYNNMLIEVNNNFWEKFVCPGRIRFTSGYKEHEKQASRIVKDILVSGLKTPRFEKYLTLAEKL